MQWSIVLVVVIGMMILVIGSRDHNVQSVKVGDSLPEIELVDIYGESVALDNLSEKPMLINLWASWCTPCVNELPLLNEAQQFAPEVDIIAINMGETLAEIQPFQERYDLTMKVLLDSRLQMKKYFNVTGYPVSIFVAADGTMQNIKHGEITDFNALLADLHDLAKD